MLSADYILDYDAITALLQTGYSRFPVHEAGKPTSFIGLLLIKKACNFPLSHQTSKKFLRLHYSFWLTTLLKPFRFQRFLFPFSLKHIHPLAVSKPWITCKPLEAAFMTLTDLSVYSQTGRAHLLLISRTPGSVGGAIGILTLEGKVSNASAWYRMCHC